MVLPSSAGPVARDLERSSAIWSDCRRVLLLFVGLGLAIGTAPGCQGLPNAGQTDSRATESPIPAPVPDDEDTDDESAGRGGSSAAADPPAEPRGRDGRPFLGFPISNLLDDSPDDDDDLGARGRPSVPDIRSPGPDTANFPNSPFTLPQGRFYIETSPAFISGPSRGTPATYNAEFLVRYGLTDRVELRLFGNGPTWERGHFAADGFAPLAYDIKTSLWKENQEYHIPAIGLEVFLLTASGSAKLNQGTQPSINLLFAHTLPYEVVLEWNVGLVGDPSPNNNFSAIEPAAAWAFEREIFPDFFGFLQGYFNGPTLPRYGDGVELGGGVRWTLSDRLALWVSYNGGVSKEAPTTIFYAGGALAF